MHRYENFPEVKEPSIYKSREKHYKNICKYAKGILVDSELGKKHVIDCYDVVEKKITVYPYKPPYYVYDYNEIDVIKKYNLRADYFFYPAQFWEHKNHRLIIEAVKLLKEKGEIINFVFVGSRKNVYEKVVELINNYGLHNQFFILGYVTNDELVSLYKRAKALVFPSFFGPTNIPPLEALALSCPVIVSDVYAHREQLEDKVIYFNPINPNDLAVNLKEITKKTVTQDFVKTENFSKNNGTKILIDLIKQN
jgi:glycosyltransferase involved in cell wall biosynthesis